MCGITGFARNKQSEYVSKAIISQMSESLKHRGPDDQGFFIDDFIVLGHRRLNIIDLKTGHQPISNEDGSVIVVLNGEIYNYRQLRSRLEVAGHKFYTNTDTETIVHLYEDFGRDCVKELNGIFAFALWDKRQLKLTLARDRLGAKPLHYYYRDGHFVFGSEIKSLLRYQFFSKEIDTVSLSKYFVYEFVPAPNSIFKQVRKLMPAHTLEYNMQSGAIKTEEYWRPDFVNKLDKISEEEASVKLLEILRSIVKEEIISDVPVGLFLSGGIDSSTLAFLLSEIGNVNSFCIGFDDKSFDESEYARIVAGYLGIKHREQILELDEVYKIIPAIADFLDEPLADPSIIPAYFLSKFASQHITVALGGDGGDELFAGYDTYQAHRLAQYYKLFPEIAKKAIYRAIDYLPVSTRNMSLDFKLKKFKSGINYKPELRNTVWLGAFNEKEANELISEDFKISESRIFEDIDAYSSELKKIGDTVERMQYLDMKFYLQDDILVKVDRASMANSLEVRVPLLNYELVDFVTRLPATMKLKGFGTKAILKKTLKNKLPDRILQRKKKGFGVPVAKWLKGELKGVTLEYLNPQRLAREGFLNPGYVSVLLQEHFNNSKDNRKKIWAILIFELWLEKYVLS